MASEKEPIIWPVAYLMLWLTDDMEREVDIPIDANAEFDIGRDQIYEALGYKDPTVSKHHFRIHCVNYGENTIENIEPMVYLRPLSKNGMLHTSKSATDGSASTRSLRRGQPSVMLNHGDTLRFSSKICIRYEVPHREGGGESPLASDVEAEAKSFEKQYTIEPRAIGAGGFARVYLANKVKARRQVACKIVPLPVKPPVPSVSDWDALPGQKAPARDAIEKVIRHRKKCEELRREFEVLKGIDHPNIIRLEKAIYAETHIYIFQELVSGGDLLSYLEMKGGLGEPEAAIIIFQLLRAVECLHAHGIVHRDIKPENILLTSWRPGARVVLTDFGQSVIPDPVKNANPPVSDALAVTRMRSMVGTRGYTAPEVYRYFRDRPPGYTDKIDMWSIGCLAGTLVTNTFLFPRERSNWPQDRDGEDQLQYGSDPFDLSFLSSSSKWRRISIQCKDFITGCAEVDERRRMTIAEALQHYWMVHQGYLKEMHAAYGRAIADWQHRDDESHLIEHLKGSRTSAELADPWYENDLWRHAPIRSRHFPLEGPSTTGQFRSFEASNHTQKQQSERLSPTAGVMSAGAKQPNTNVDLPASTNNLGRPNPHHGTKSPINDEMSYLSIQDYAPPATLPASTTAQQDLPPNTEWQTQLAQSMDLDTESPSLSPMRGFGPF